MAKLVIEREIDSKKIYSVMVGTNNVHCIHEHKLTSFDDMDMCQFTKLNKNIVYISQKGVLDGVPIMYGICEQCGKFYCYVKERNVYSFDKETLTFTKIGGSENA